MTVREARDGDLPDVLAIYNEVVATTTAIYRDVPTTLEDRAEWWRGRVSQGYPVLVAVDGAEVLGFASFGDFRLSPGYRYTVEHTVHVRVDRRGQGVGGALMAPLIACATSLGKHVMVGAVDADIEFVPGPDFDHRGRLGVARSHVRRGCYRSRSHNSQCRSRECLEC
jgi:phosphinothricin acetyltransferase